MRPVALIIGGVVALLGVVLLVGSLSPVGPVTVLVQPVILQQLGAAATIAIGALVAWFG